MHSSSPLRLRYLGISQMASLFVGFLLTSASLNAQNLHLGDLDDDGVVTVRDLVLLNDHIGETPSVLSTPGPFDAKHAVLADVNKDGAINAADRDELVREILQSRNPEQLPLATIRFASPAAGEGDVSVNRETILHFTVPLAINATIDTTSFRAEFAGRQILSRAEISSDRKKATLFYLEPLPANSRVKVTFDGSALTDLIGRGFDADGDGVAGGIYRMSFDTHSSSPIPATGITGRVVLAAPEGSATVPPGFANTGVPGVTITVDGQEQTLRTTTDAQGYFTLNPCPSGVFFVHIDGRTSPWSSFPNGSYFPNVGKKWEAIAGKADNPSGSSEDSLRGTVYLPCVCPGTLQPVSQTQATTVGFPQEVLDANPELAGTTFTFPANTAFSDDGTRGGSLGPAPVPADRLPSPLPPGLRLPFVFSLQTSGPTNFERPVAVCLPNLPDPLTGYKPVPGEKTALVAFNHDTGQWEVVGPMTVTADGNFMKSDPGVGLRQPGWGGGTPGGTAPGTGGDGGDPDDGDKPPEPCPPTDIDEALRSPYRRKDPNYEPKGNGCGQAGGRQFPSNTFGADFLPACNAHDVGYGTYSTDDGHKNAVDDAFLSDLIEAVNAALQNGSLPSIAYGDAIETAIGYHAAVSNLGGEAYKNAQYDASDWDCPDDTQDAPAFGTTANPKRLSNAPLHYAIKDLYSDTIVQRGVTRGGKVGINNLILSPDGLYRAYLVDGTVNGVGDQVFGTKANGTRFQIPRIYMSSSVSPDTDGDSLTDEIETIIGTSATNPDTDGDGVTDGAELKNGSDPLSGLAVSSGVIARAPLSGTCIDIASGRDVLAAACGTEGVYILGVRQGLTPTRLAQINTTPNAANIVTISSNLLAIGLGSTGTMIVDISTPDAPQFLRLIKIGSSVRSLAAAEGIVHIGLEDGRVAQVDMITGRLIGSVNIGAAPHDLAIGKGVLYAVVPGSLKTLPVTIGGYGSIASIGFSGAVPNTTLRHRLFKGSNRLYATHRSGFGAYNISTPGAPALIQDNSTAALGWGHLVATGSNLAVACLGANNPDDVSLYDLGTNGAQANFLTTFSTPGAASAVTIYNGLAYIADGSAGVQVVNFRAFDTLGQPPTVTLALETPATTAEEGRFLPVIATATDDVQVRNVEFLVDGERLETDGNFPFEARVLTPRLEPGKTSFTVQARATDTGGNASFSNILTLDLTPDTQSPSVLAFTPGNDALLTNASGFTARFTEPVAAASLNASGVYLWSAGTDGNVGTDDDVRMPVTLLPATDGNGTFRDTASFQAASPLAPGRYRVLLTLGITDAKGNPLAAPFSSTFQVISGNDADGDGIADNVEATLGLDPENQDSNGNGIPDGGEDYDGDGLGNAWELRYGFDPRLVDTNSNGTNDNLEDGDLDTLNALAEQSAGSDPTKNDTDGDGWPDQVEVEFFSNPADAKSKPLSLFVGAPAATTTIIGGGTNMASPLTNIAIIGASTNIASPPINIAITGGGTNIANPPVTVRSGNPQP